VLSVKARLDQTKTNLNLSRALFFM